MDFLVNPTQMTTYDLCPMLPALLALAALDGLTCYLGAPEWLLYVCMGVGLCVLGLAMRLIFTRTPKVAVVDDCSELKPVSLFTNVAG